MVYRSTDPSTFDDVDGIVIAETAPPPSVQGVPTNVALLVGQFQRGPTTLTQVSSAGAFLEKFGSSSFSGNTALKNKKFGVLKIKRVVAADAAKASVDIEADASGGGAVIRFTAKYKGAYGNSLTVSTEAGESGGTTYTFKDGNTGSVLQNEIYRDIDITAITSSTFALSKIFDVSVLDDESGEPATVTDEAATTGSDGTIADTDYQTALGECEEEGVCNVVFLDSYNATRRGYLKTHASNTQDRMVIMEDETVHADADTAVTAWVADVASYRDTDGRIIYAINDPQTTIDSVATYTSPAAWAASIISQTPAWVDPAAARTKAFTGGITGLRYTLKRSHYVQLKNAGICGFESLRGEYKLKSGIVTQIANSSKRTILRRRMADYLTNSVAVYLENFQNEPNRASDRDDQAAAILAFVRGQENDRILPKDSEVQGGRAKIVDAQVLNTDDSIAAGFNKILWKQRIYSSQRFIVLQAEIGESVVVTESE